MRYMLMTTGTASNSASPNPEALAVMGKLIEELTRSGALLATGGLSANPTRIKSSDGKVTVTDGPFTESKELVVGFALVEAKTKEEAIELSKRFWQVAGDGQGDIYEVF